MAGYLYKQNLKSIGRKSSKYIFDKYTCEDEDFSEIADRRARFWIDFDSIEISSIKRFEDLKKEFIDKKYKFI